MSHPDPLYDPPDNPCPPGECDFTIQSRFGWRCWKCRQVSEDGPEEED